MKLHIAKLFLFISVFASSAKAEDTQLYQYANGYCHGGTYFKVGKLACNLPSALQAEAAAACKYSCSNDTGKCGVNSYNLGSSCIKQINANWRCVDYTKSSGSSEYLLRGSQILPCPLDRAGLYDLFVKLRSQVWHLCKDDLKNGYLNDFVFNDSACGIK